jgi:Tfp pilus assembly protein PilZ
MDMDIDQKVCEQLILSRQLLEQPQAQDSAPLSPLNLLHGLMVSYGAAELALAAICVQLDCVPEKKNVSLPDYFDALQKKSRHGIAADSMDYVLELHEVRSDMQLRFRIPDLHRWRRAKAETLEHVGEWGKLFLGLSLFDLNSVPAQAINTSASAASETGPSDPLHPDRVVAPRYDCAGSAEIRLARGRRLERGAIANLSVGGCSLKSEFPFDIGERVEMILRINQVSFLVVGNVVHIPSLDAVGKSKSSGQGMGIQFKNMTEGARARVLELIAELNRNRMLRRRQLIG